MDSKNFNLEQDTLPNFDQFKEHWETKINGFTQVLGNSSTAIEPTLNMLLTRCSYFKLSDIKNFIDYLIQKGANKCFIDNIDNHHPTYADSKITYFNENNFKAKIIDKTYIYIIYNIRLVHPNSVFCNFHIVSEKFNVSLQDLIDYPDLYKNFKAYFDTTLIKPLSAKDLLQVYKSNKEQQGSNYKFNEINDIWLQENNKLILE